MSRTWMVKAPLVSFLFFIVTAYAQQFEETPGIVVSPDFCSLYPLTIPSSLMVSAQPGDAFNKLPTGTGAGNYSWLTWAGQNDVNTVAASLIPPGNSDTYVNPNHANDHRLDVNDWVEGAPGVINAIAIRHALDALIGHNIVLPVWESYEKQGGNLNYHTNNFAVVELTDYQLNGHGYISYIFKRFTRCYNHRPVALDDNIETPEDTAVTFNLRAEDNDNNNLVFEVLTQTINGTLEVTGQQITYLPNANYNGSDKLTFVVHDNEQLSNIATVTITVKPVNDPPVADDKSAEGLEDTPIDLVFTGSDIEQSPLAFRPVSQPTNGALFENDGNWQYIPNPNYFGTDSFTYVANDSELDSEPASYVIQVLPVNDPPTAENIIVEVEAGEPVDVTLTGADIDNAELQFILDKSPEHGEFSGISPNLTYVSDRLYNGLEQVTYRAFDGELYSEPAVIEITVVRRNEPPVIISPPYEITPERQIYAYPVIVDDPNLDPIVYKLDRAPTGMTIDRDSGVINWLPDDNFVQTVPTFNQQCYIVPTGSVKEYEEGDENKGQKYISPLSMANSNLSGGRKLE